MNDNPLKQYFRRPSIYIKLPSRGKYYDSTVLQRTENGELPVYPMTAIDEITSRTPDALYNGHAVTEIIKSCIPSIIDPWQINSIDLEALLIAIRVASTGEELEINSTCPACGEDGKYSVMLMDLLSSVEINDYDRPLKIRELEIGFRPLTYSETNKNNLIQYELQKTITAINDMPDDSFKEEKTKEILKRLTESMLDVVANTVAYIKTPETVVTNSEHIKEFIKNCDRKTNTMVKEYSIQLREKNKLKPLKAKCPSCSHEYNQEIILNMTDFFE